MNKCATKVCKCAVGSKPYEYEGKLYCCETCAKECTVDKCVCVCCAGKC